MTRYQQTRAFTGCCLAFALLLGQGRGVLAQDQPIDKEQPLIEILESTAPKADKAIACKQLAVWGSEKAVPALAALLPDPELTSWARIALEVIPGEAADNALCEAAGKVEGRTLIGVINSIGVRRCAAGEAALTKCLKNSDTAVASSAAAALGKIATESATATLQAALADSPAGVHSAVAEGCILCAESLLAGGKAEAAAKLYDQIRESDVPKPRIIEATRGAILARGSAGVELLIAQLNSDDKAMSSIALMTARELPGEDVTKALVAAMDNVPKERQNLLILALADRGDTAALPAMLKAAQDGSAVSRIAAIEVLKELGDASCVAALIDVATDENADVAAAAKTALEQLAGDDVNTELASRLEEARGDARLALIELIGRRRIASAADTLLKSVDDSDAAVRAATLIALGEVIKLDNLNVLITRAIDDKYASDSEVALKALQAACVRMPDREATATQLAAAIAKADVAAKCKMLEILGAMGGPKALETVGIAANSDDATLQDVSTQILGNWMTVDAGSVLLQLAKKPDYKYGIRALRGQIRLVRQFLMEDDQRVAMCRDAWAACTRDAERKLVLEVIARYPSVDMLRLAIEAGKTESMKDEAAAAAMTVAQQISGGSDVQQLLAQINQEPVKIVIEKATYGAGNKQKDVTRILQKHVRQFPLIVLPSTSYNSAFGGDPASGVVKQLVVQYTMDGKAGKATFAENATILLPKP